MAFARAVQDRVEAMKQSRQGVPELPQNLPTALHTFSVLEWEESDVWGFAGLDEFCLPEGVQKSLYPRRMEAILSKGASRECCCTSPLRDPVQMVTVLKESIGNLLILYICSSTKIKESTCFEKKSRVWILR